MGEPWSRLLGAKSSKNNGRTMEQIARGKELKKMGTPWSRLLGQRARKNE